jgi:CheY-like chemotaxis protein
VFEDDPNVPRYVCSDEAKLRQILINLIGNAIKFTTQGGVLVRVRVTASQPIKPGCMCYPKAMPTCRAFNLSLIVKDTGCGIDRRDWESIFEAFMQTEQGRHAEGTGLGLCISRQFARLMGGDITVQSSVNQGSTFTCQITLHQPEGMSLLEAETDHFVIGMEPDEPTYRILVAEDAVENRQLLTTLLASIGFEVNPVKDGAEAIAEWRVWQPHLILMDVQMSGINGYEATQQIRLQEASEQRSPTPIIALTAYAFEVDRQVSLQAGCNEHIIKPFNETTLFEAIARYLKVRYRYSSKPQAAPPHRSLSPQDLTIMSSEWRTQVHEAALDLQDDRVNQLIAQIPDTEQWLIEAMTSLVHDLQFEAIATLTQSQEG